LKGLLGSCPLGGVSYALAFPLAVTVANMLSLRSKLLKIRRIAAAPLRRQRVKRLGTQGKAPIHCLFYHRVADEHPNDWTIGRAAFEAQIDYLRSRFEIIGLDELQRRVRQCDSHRSAVAITFDDGYADNSRFALPLLMRHKIPCTYFATVQNVTSGRPFEHDIQAGQPLTPNTVEELRAAAEGGIEIGLHTRTHFDFANVDDSEVIRSEIDAAMTELSDLIGRRVRYFAFPYGLPPQLTQAAIQAVQAAGMEGFCSAFGAYNLPGRDAFHIRRFHGDPEPERFLNWLEFDQRKVRREPLISYPQESPTTLDQASAVDQSVHEQVS